MKRLLVKLWWSLIAPKDKSWRIDEDYLLKISELINWISYFDQIILIHGAGSIWHWFVKKYWISTETYPKIRKILDDFYRYISQGFPSFQRMSIDWYSDVQYWRNLIIGWDITADLRLISGDELFAYYLETQEVDVAVILTDVDWIYDAENNIIPFVNKHTIDGINFWQKAWDVTWGMKNKLTELFSIRSLWTNKVVIMNGTNIEWIKNFLQNWITTWTTVSIH